MQIWSAEIKELEKLFESLKGQLPDLEKELEPLIRTEDANVILLYSRRCLEVMITYLCECELKRPRGTEPLKGIIDKLNKERKIPSHIITSMHGLNDLSTYGTHPKDFDPGQVKPVLNNLDVIIKWYLKYKDLQIESKSEQEAAKHETNKITASPQERSIIVLPFENMSPDPDQEYFSDGLTEEIISDLSHIHDLLVISRSSAMTFKGTKKKIGEIAGDVNVHYVLEGSVRKAGNNLRITAQLIDGMTDSHLWAEKYNGTLDDVFDIQEKVSQSIVDALRIKISPEEREKIHERPIDNALAYDCYKKAYSEIITFVKERIDLGLNLLHKGLNLTGENAMIYSGMAFVYFQYANIGLEQEENIKRSEEFIKKALDIDPELAEAHFVYANILMIFQANIHEAISHLKMALINKPDHPETLTWLSWWYLFLGKPDIAKPIADRLIIIDPLNIFNINFHGIFHFMMGRFEQALDPLLELYRLFPEGNMWQLWKTLALMYNDHLSEAYDFLNETVKEPGQDAISGLLIFLKYALKGDDEKVISLLTPDFVKAMQTDCQYSWHMAAFYSYLGDKEKSLDWLENSVDRGFINYPFLNDYDPLLEKIRGEERFKKLMERVKYEWENFEI